MDWVVPFGEDTPAALIKEVGPLVLAKGGDYKPEEIAGADAVKHLGGRIAILRYHDGLSTSRLLDRISE
ncbi:MAG: hypothetical protein F4222_04540 [Gammaproteobacteria bacterium]|nr:hypothetical protein [Gammaproteobacteria bacterium]